MSWKIFRRDNKYYDIDITNPWIILYTSMKFLNQYATYIKLLSICFVSSDDLELAKLIQEQ